MKHVSNENLQRRKVVEELKRNEKKLRSATGEEKRNKRWDSVLFETLTSEVTVSR